MDKNKLPIISQYIFNDKLFGMELYIPISKDHEDVLRKVKIIDALHFEACDGIHDVSEIDQNNFGELIRIADKDMIFNPEYYIPGNLYVRYSSGDTSFIDELVEYTPKHLDFAKHYCDIDDTWREYHRGGYGMGGEFFKLWIEFGPNRVEEVISDEPVLVSDDIECRRSEKTIFEQVLFYDKKGGHVYRVRDISRDRKTDITLEDINGWNSLLHLGCDKFLKTMTPIKFVKSRGKLTIKECDISNYLTAPSFNHQFEDEIRALIVKRKSDPEWYVAEQSTAEWLSVIPAKNYSYKDKPDSITLEPGDVEEIYLITCPSNFLHAIKEYFTDGIFRYDENEVDDDE